ncbi:MAG: hypothetical protein CM15mV84_290 [uncultured marine virus]|nr:MAG: hypothetical protein CM15mV84_290 [uncultured marine virus]
MKQNGINPKSELGLKLQNLYRQKGFTAENQFSLGEDYERKHKLLIVIVKALKLLVMRILQLVILVRSKS